MLDLAGRPVGNPADPSVPVGLGAPRIRQFVGSSTLVCSVMASAAEDIPARPSTRIGLVAYTVILADPD